jgi:hypothetical protein
MLILLHTVVVKIKLALTVHLNIVVLDFVKYCHSIIKSSNITVCLLSRYELGQWHIWCDSKLWVSLTANYYKLYIPVLLSKGFSVSISDQSVGWMVVEMGFDMAWAWDFYIYFCWVKMRISYFFCIWEHFQKGMGQDEFWDSTNVTVPNQSKTLAPISKDLDVSTVIPDREQREWLLTLVKI